MDLTSTVPFKGKLAVSTRNSILEVFDFSKLEFRGSNFIYKKLFAALFGSKISMKIPPDRRTKSSIAA